MKAFIIYLPSKPHSVEHAKSMMATLHGYGLEPELYQGVNGVDAMIMKDKDNRVLYPYSIKTTTLSDEELAHYIRPEKFKDFKQNHHINILKKQYIGHDNGKMNMPGVVGCFYSHYMLWKKCVELDEPIMIFEDDVKFYRGWIEVDWKDILILSLGKTAYLNPPYDDYLNNPSGNVQPYEWHTNSMPGTSGYAIKPKAARKLLKFYRGYFAPADNAINQFICKIEIHNHLMGRHMSEDEGNVSMTRTNVWNEEEDKE